MASKADAATLRSLKEKLDGLMIEEEIQKTIGTRKTAAAINTSSNSSNHHRTNKPPPRGVISEGELEPLYDEEELQLLEQDLGNARQQRHEQRQTEMREVQRKKEEMEQNGEGKVVDRELKNFRYELRKLEEQEELEKQHRKQFGRGFTFGGTGGTRGRFPKALQHGGASGQSSREGSDVDGGDEYFYDDDDEEFEEDDEFYGSSFSEQDGEVLIGVENVSNSSPTNSSSAPRSPNIESSSQSSPLSPPSKTRRRRSSTKQPGMERLSSGASLLSEGSIKSNRTIGRRSRQRQPSIHSGGSGILIKSGSNVSNWGHANRRQSRNPGTRRGTSTMFLDEIPSVAVEHVEDSSMDNSPTLARAGGNAKLKTLRSFSRGGGKSLLDDVQENIAAEKRAQSKHASSLEAARAAAQAAEAYEQKYSSMRKQLREQVLREAFGDGFRIDEAEEANRAAAEQAEKQSEESKRQEEERERAQQARMLQRPEFYFLSGSVDVVQVHLNMKQEESEHQDTPVDTVAKAPSSLLEALIEQASSCGVWASLVNDVKPQPFALPSSALPLVTNGAPSSDLDNASFASQQRQQMHSTSLTPQQNGATLSTVTGTAPVNPLALSIEVNNGDDGHSAGGHNNNNNFSPASTLGALIVSINTEGESSTFTETSSDLILHDHHTTTHDDDVKKQKKIVSKERSMVEESQHEIKSSIAVLQKELSQLEEEEAVVHARYEKMERINSTSPTKRAEDDVKIIADGHDGDKSDASRLTEKQRERLKFIGYSVQLSPTAETAVSPEEEEGLTTKEKQQLKQQPLMLPPIICKSPASTATVQSQRRLDQMTRHDQLYVAEVAQDPASTGGGRNKLIKHVAKGADNRKKALFTNATRSATPSCGGGYGASHPASFTAGKQPVFLPPLVASPSQAASDETKTNSSPAEPGKAADEDENKLTAASEVHELVSSAVLAAALRHGEEKTSMTEERMRRMQENEKKIAAMKAILSRRPQE